jgi:superfamily II DNA or RNA helicase
MKLWNFQKVAGDEAMSTIGKKQRLLVVSPAGSGKTVMIGDVVGRALLAGYRRVLVVSHRKEIIDQTATILGQMGLGATDIGVLRGNASYHLHAPVVIASAASLRARKWMFKNTTDLVIVDEAHHVLAEKYRETIEYFDKARHLGYTATPFRLDGMGLKDFYDKMFVAARPSNLIDDKMLSKPLVYRAPAEFMPDLRDLRIAHGDYITKDLYERVNTTKLMGNLVSNYQKRANGKRAIAFAVSVEHSKLIASQFNSAGIPAAHVDGTMDDEERDDILRDFRDGKTHILSNCFILSEGYDLPDCEVVILARPTKSLTLFLQQTGRAMRFKDGKKPVVLDHAQLLEQFGLPYADREFQLINTKIDVKVVKPASVKDCPECGAVLLASVGSCEECGFVFETVVRQLPEVVQTTLVPYSEAEKTKLEQKLKVSYPPEWVEKIMKIWVGHREKNA